MKTQLLEDPQLQVSLAQLLGLTAHSGETPPMTHTGLGFASESDHGATHAWLLLAALPWGTGVPWLLAHLCNFPTEISLSEPIA